MSDSVVGREIVPLPAPLAAIVVAYAKAGAQLPTLEFAAVQKVRMDREGATDRDVAGTFGLMDGGAGIVELAGRFALGDDEEAVEIAIALTDGSTVRSNEAFVSRVGTSIRKGQTISNATHITLGEWCWTTKETPVAWVGVLHGVQFDTSNLVVRGEGYQNAQPLRLSGAYDWHFVQKGAAGALSCVVVVDTKGEDVERMRLWRDFAALEFLFGRPLRLDVLAGVNERGEAVSAQGGFGVGFRYRADANRHPPLPDERGHAWMALAFPLVSQALDGPDPNPVTIATSGYVDSTIGHVDGQYLFAQIALEAAAYRLTPEGKPVVKDEAAWKSWAKAQRGVLVEHAIDESAVNSLAQKLRDAARPTTASLVKRTLEAMNIQAPKEALKEIEGRNGVAHTFSMTRGSAYEPEKDLRRIRMIRTLLAGMILRHVGYKGALSDWDRNEDRSLKLAEWFPIGDEARKEAGRIYEAVDVGAKTPSEPTAGESRSSTCRRWVHKLRHLAKKITPP